MHKSGPQSVAKASPAKAGRKGATAPYAEPSKSNVGSHFIATASLIAGAPTSECQLDASIQTKSGGDLTEKLRELLMLAKEQGHLSYDDIDEVLSDSVVTPEDLDQIYAKLNNLEVQIVDQAEVDRVKDPEVEEEKERLDTLDDPVRMYLRQMGKVPLLTREQESRVDKTSECQLTSQRDSTPVAGPNAQQRPIL